MNHNYDDLRSLYRAAAREEQPTRADQRAVRAAILGAGVSAIALHTSTAAGKLIALIPGGAKVLTIGQVVVYAGLGAAVGGGLAAVGVAVSPKVPMSVNSAAASTSAHGAPARVNSQATKPATSAADRPEDTKPADFAPIAQPKSPSSNATTVDRPLPSGTTITDRPVPQQRTTPLLAPALAPTAVAPPPAPGAPSLAQESRGLAAVQTALNAHDANRALALLDAQDRDYRTGSLGQERAAARVLALCMAGRHVEALAAKDRFISRYPGSPLIRRLNAACKK